MQEFTIYTDGASRGNPGEAGAGVLITGDNGSQESITRYLGTATNNVAEYTAALLGLERALDLGATRVTLYADSELLVKQLNGQYRVKNSGLIPLYTRARELIAKIGRVEVYYIPRGKNKEADALANKAIDEKANSK